MNDLLRSVQRALYTTGGIVSAGDRAVDIAFDESEVAALETEIDRVSAELPELQEFIFPGAAKESRRFHMARAIARRAELGIAALAA